VAPAGLLSNLAIVPLAELGIVPLGLAGCLLSLVHAGLGGLLLDLAGLGAWAMAGLVRWFAAWAPSWRVATPSLLELGAWYVGLAAVALAGRRAWRIAGVCALMVASVFAVRLAAARASTVLTATFLDVGQGDACVLELPHGRVVVVDGGGSFDPGFDPGSQVIAPFLWRRGISRIDVVVLSHPHPDHANGLPFLVEHFEVGELWTNGQDSGLPALARLRELAGARRVPLALPRPLELAGVRLVPLAPLDGAGEIRADPAASENDNSLVLEVAYRDRKLLFAGDLEADGEAELVRRGVRPVEVLKVPHHGSRTSSTAGLLAASRPQLAVISVGERNRWGFPHPSVLARYGERGTRVARTDRDGAVTVRITSGGTVAIETVAQPGKEAR
jgi:competence protein ComEC